MADPAYLSIQKFMNEYDSYCAECDYTVSWISTIKAKAEALQADPNYAIALSAAERLAVDANLTAAISEPIKSAKPINLEIGIG